MASTPAHPADAATTGRIPIMDVTPAVEGGRYPAKAAVGEPFEVSALIFREGHDQFGADVVLTDPSGTRRSPVRMYDAARDVSRMSAVVTPDVEGDWTFEVQAYSDPLATWLHDAPIKIRAGVDVELMFTQGQLLIDRVLDGPGFAARSAHTSTNGPARSAHTSTNTPLVEERGAPATSRETMDPETNGPARSAHTSTDTPLVEERGAPATSRETMDPETDGPDRSARQLLADARTALGDAARPIEARLAVVESPDLARVFADHPLRDLLSNNGPHRLQVDRNLALFSSWYEFFPRSEGAVANADGSVTSGTFRTAAERLPAVAAMGFDVLYLPPIHPIGEINRKGRNNTLTPDESDVGSPWAIGSKDGGHDAVHPDLGTLADFDAFVKQANDLGLEIALDFALQAAPDHPWVATNPEWFTTRADGTIAFAENPPKKYQDIYPINFDNDPAGIYAESERVLRHWMAHGVRIFRVDNPHTKPIQFWEWLIGRIRATDPDVLFLSEAFTKPPMMRALAAAGFHQSYTYFTWRTNRTELENYLTEVSHETGHVMRPNFFVNTPDILHAYLQYGGPAAFKIRAALAATGSPNWGVYAGFELYEHVAVKPGSEEYLDSEKYQIRIRDWAKSEAEGRSLAPYLTRLNEIRRDHPALQQLRNVVIHSSDDDSVLVFSKHASHGAAAVEERAAPSVEVRAERAAPSVEVRAERAAKPAAADIVIVVVNLDPHGTRETTIHLDLPKLGLDWNSRFAVHDEITGADWHWGAHNYVRLDPGHEPAHVVTVRS